MRVRIEVRAEGTGWSITYRNPTNGATIAPQRVLSRFVAPCQRFPISPAHDAANCPVGARILCEDQAGDAVTNAWEAVNRVDASPADACHFGHYLFEALIGDSWPAIDQAAGAGADLEIEILFNNDTGDLSRLPWEMMHGKDEPIAAEPGRRIAITRIIEPVRPIQQPEPIQLPLRVLFVVGRQIDNSLRPGAELIGLLRRVRLPVDDKFQNFQTADVHVRYLAEAAWDEIESAAREFRPAVVHIVSHGEVDPDSGQTRLLLTARETDTDPQSPKTANVYRCSAKRLLELIAVSGSPPPAVIVNACHTADAPPEISERSGSEMALGFSAELVRGGVAVAIGMSGEVADRACQIFTMRFYQALLQGASVSLASAQGRRAARLVFSDEIQNVEWTRPTLFLANGIDPVLRVKPAARDFSGIAESYRKVNKPVELCDRYDLMQRYEEFRDSLPAQPGRAAAIAFVVKRSGQLGKTRLLEEIAARAVLDRLIPVIVRNSLANPEAPQNAFEMAKQISDAIKEARQNFSLPPKTLTNIERFAYEQLLKIVPDPGNVPVFVAQQRQLKQFLAGNRTSGDPAGVDVDMALQLIRADCAELLNDAHAADAETVLLLLDDLHRYSGISLDLLDRIRQHGAGDRSLPIPIIFTFSALDAEGRALEEALRKRSDIRTLPLSAFESDIDQQLALTQFMLSHYLAAPSPRRDAQQLVAMSFMMMKKFSEGIPGQLLTPNIEAVVETGRNMKALLAADFLAALSRWK